jgi:pimeloyl-ACP methyl ester carboxylesterase
MKAVIPILSIVLVLYIGACIALYVLQRSMIYFPQRGEAADPAARLVLQVPGADVHVTVRPHAGPKAILYFGGNSEDVSGSLPAFSRAFPDHAIYLMHYRGFGASTGKPTEASLQADALALFDSVQREHPDIAVIGRSLGSGVAVRLAAERPVSRLVLVTPYDSIQEIAAGHYPYFPVRWLLTDKFESIRHAPAIKAPTLILQAERDAVVPGPSTARLNAAFAAGVASLLVVPGTDHNTISESPLYLAAMQNAISPPVYQ